MATVVALFIGLAGPVPQDADKPTVFPEFVDKSVPLEPPRTNEPKPLPNEERRPSRKLEDRPATGGPSLGGFIFWSIVVFGLMIGTFVLLKRYARNSRFLGGTPAIDVLARKPLAPRQDVFLVEVGGKVFLIGATKEHMTTLGEISQPDQVALLKSKCPGKKSEATTEIFHKSLREGIEDYEKGGPPEAPRYEGLLEELSSLKKTVAAWKA